MHLEIFRILISRIKVKSNIGMLGDGKKQNLGMKQF
jgi:hypothetical protein